jgi:hypothetical protein
VFGRTGLSDGLTGRFRLEYTLDRRTSASFSSRTFDIRGIEAEPSVDIILGPRLTVTPGVLAAGRKDRSSGGTANLYRVPVEGLYQAGGSIRVTSRAEWNHVALDRDVFGLTAFELTDGRGAGTSYLWNLGVRWLVNDSLTATLVYDGRAPEGRAAIHTARFQLRAEF